MCLFSACGTARSPCLTTSHMTRDCGTAYPPPLTRSRTHHASTFNQPGSLLWSRLREKGSFKSHETASSRGSYVPAIIDSGSSCLVLPDDTLDGLLHNRCHMGTREHPSFATVGTPRPVHGMALGGSRQRKEPRSLAAPRGDVGRYPSLG